MVITSCVRSDGGWGVVSSTFGGTSTSRPICRMGMATMKMISSTSTTSTSGVMLISDLTPLPPALKAIYILPWAISVPACLVSVRIDTRVNSASFAAFITSRTFPKLIRLSALSITARDGSFWYSDARYVGRFLSGIHLSETNTEPSDLMEMIRSPSLPGRFSACGPVGSSTSTPCWSMGVTTMKMIRSTRQTSTSGVTLMSPFTSSGLPPPAPNAMSLLLRGASLDRARLVLDEVVDQLRRRVRHLHLETLDLAHEVVVHPHRGDGDEQPERGRCQGLGDPGRHGAETAGTGEGHASESVDDADDSPEQTDERRGRGDRGQVGEALLHLRAGHERLALDGPPPGLDDVEILGQIL